MNYTIKDFNLLEEEKYSLNVFFNLKKPRKIIF